MLKTTITTYRIMPTAGRAPQLKQLATGSCGSKMVAVLAENGDGIE